MLECVVNISEGREPDLVDRIAATAGRALLDVHRDPDHNRSVLTLIGEQAPRQVAAEAVRRLDLAAHEGAHPRIGVVDVVPFVPLGSETMAAAELARDGFARWFADELDVPCFCYGTTRTLPEIRRQAFHELPPDTGPDRPHPTAGACAVGARAPLVAYNLWLTDADVETARAIAAELRGPTVRALGLAVGDAVQVSMNLIAPQLTGPADVYDAVDERAAVDRAELVGLAPAGIVDAVDPDRWDQLDLSPERTIEARAAAQGWTIS